MASDAGVDELVQNDIVSQVRRHDSQQRVELNAAATGGAAPDSPLSADAQAAWAVSVFAGQCVQASGEIRPGGGAVQTLGRQDRLTAAVPGALDKGQPAPDPTQLSEGETPGLVERHAPGDRDADPPGGPYGQRDAAGPPRLFEQHGADTVEHEHACAFGRRRGLAPAK